MSNIGLPADYNPIVTTYVSERGETLKITDREHQNLSNMTQMGVFGNIWVHGHHLVKAGDANPGHHHNHDHVTMLAQGSVKCEVENEQGEISEREFHAPTFIVIDKNKKHRLTALVDNVYFYCVFALRDEHGEVTDLYTGDHSPYYARRD
jgi:hypothetical protein